jgi:hypothetical protein
MWQNYLQNFRKPNKFLKNGDQTGNVKPKQRYILCGRGRKKGWRSVNIWMANNNPTGH